MRVRIYRDGFGYEHLTVTRPDGREWTGKCRYSRWGGNSLLPVWEWAREKYLALTGRKILPAGGGEVEVEESELLHLLKGVRRNSLAGELREWLQG